ncbi:MAG: tRNA lysidine(34) synthetase TilS [Lachnospiraceae bacterium]|nr:tRNA lysidine(34) synthetase TilS [Lachnospiraceae bacterium]
MVEKIKAYIQKNQMIMPGDHILAGISGGADSVCLFFLLHDLQSELDFDMTVLHVNHRLRDTAERDEQFVKNLCQKNRVAFLARHADVSTLAREQGLSLEEAARIARYEIFEKEAKNIRRRLQTEPGKVKIAVAHHQNDQAETVLFQMFRGSALRGLRGMKPVRRQGEMTIIRPMLTVGREEIEAYLSRHGQQFMTDETNEDNRYARNRIRNEILPIAEEHICRESVRHIAQTASDILMAEEYLDSIVSAEYEALIKKADSSLFISCEKFADKHAYLKQEIVYRAITHLAGKNKDITRSHVESVLRLFEMQVGRRVDLPYRICAVKDYDAVKLYVEAEGERDPAVRRREEIGMGQMWEEPLHIPGSLTLPDGSTLFARVFDYEKTMEIPKNEYTKWFDYDKIKKHPVVRNRRVSDYFYIDQSHTKTVKDYMINEKIRQEHREKLYLICEDHHMLWMPGYRISAYYKVSDETKKVLELTYGGTENGGKDKRHDL